MRERQTGGIIRKAHTPLTEEQIVSNMFVYAFAGNDTTAIVLHHILVNLAAHPETQTWLAEEIQHYLPDDDTSSWSYNTFPKLKRCQAVIVSLTPTLPRISD